jgi:hypothetical protein
LLTGNDKFILIYMPRKLLLTLHEKEQTIQDMTKAEIIEAIQMRDFDEAIEALKAANPKKNDVILVASRWKGLERDMTKGIISMDYADRVRNQIAAALMELAEKLPENAPVNEGGSNPGGGTSGGSGGGPLNVFISYNHRDAETAHRMRSFLQEKNIEVTIDSEAMKAGEDIKKFIERCIRDSDVTLSLVSENSLLSAWVGMETVNTLVGEGIAGKRFIPVSIQTEFFDPSFVDTAIETIDKQLAEIKDQMIKRISADIGIEDLQNDRTRYNKLRTELPSIVGTLKGRLTIDISGDNFTPGMERVVSTLRS